MSSAFFGLNTAVRALMAQQQAIDTVNHNVANANTPGYSRQRVDLAAAVPYTMPTFTQNMAGGQIGTGVEVRLTERLRDGFLDYQVRYQTTSLGRWEIARDTLQRVEVVYNEPSESGLNALLGRFWQAWQDLTNNPTSPALRSNLRELGASLSSMFNRTYQQLQDSHSDLNRQVSLQVMEANSLARQIADLNLQIKQVQFTGAEPNDLRDKRDLLLDQLAKLTNITYQEDATGVVTVSIGTRQLVDGMIANELTALPDGSGNYFARWASDGALADITGGQLQGLISARDNIVQAQIDKVNDLAAALIREVNEQHRLGFGTDDSTDNDFFAGAGASDMAVGAAIQGDLAKIAASSAAGQVGNGENAIAIAALEEAIITIGAETASMRGFYQALVTQLGVQAREATNMASNQTLLVGHLERQRQAVCGVNIDEEVANLVRYQHAYQAAARVLTVQDEVLDKLINGTGIVGR